MLTSVRGTLRGVVALAVFLAYLPVATANVHLWAISQVYTNDDGSVQYVELFTSSAGQEFFTSFGNAARVQSRTPGSVVDDTYFIPGDSPTNTANKHVLIGTPNVAAVFGVVPDFATLQPTFLLNGGGIVNLSSPNWGNFGTKTYPALPGENTSYYVGGIGGDGHATGLFPAVPNNFAGSVAGTNGDFDDNGTVNSADIDILWHIVRGIGSDPGNNDAADLDGSGYLNEDDVDTLLASKLSPDVGGAGSRYGDADLDDDVDGADFDLWRTRPGYTGANGTWSIGDFDGDGDIDGADFDLWRTRPTTYPTTVGPHAAGIPTSAVPEPAALLLAVAGLASAAAMRRLSRA